jgi:hypothetical protein
VARVTVVALAVLVVGCGGPTGTPRPSASLEELEFTPRPSTTATPSAAPTSGPSVAAPWPVGWDVAFCQMFNEAVVAQQLIVDVERALDEGVVRDARLLAEELGLTAAAARALLLALSEWDDAAAATGAIAALLDVDIQASAEYATYFSEDKRAALRRARDLRRQNAAQVPAANDELATVAAAGVECPGTPLVLESP